MSPIVEGVGGITLKGLHNACYTITMVTMHGISSNSTHRQKATVRSPGAWLKSCEAGSMGLTAPLRQVIMAICSLLCQVDGFYKEQACCKMLEAWQ